MKQMSVLFVGLNPEQRQEVWLPDSAEGTSVDSVAEAVNIVSLTPPTLIVANDKIGELDSLDFFTKVLNANPDADTPVFFLATPGSGVQPFVYEHRRSGFTVRYLDTEGRKHEHFIKEASTEKDFTVRAINHDQISDEVNRCLSGEGGAADTDHEDDFEARVWELGFNQDFACGEQSYHVQTEVIELEPLTVSTTVFNAGQAVHSHQQKIRMKEHDLRRVRIEVESIHVSVVSRVRSGELP